MKGLRRLSPRRFWSTESGLTALLVLMILALVGRFGLSEFTLGRLAADIFFTLVILAGVVTTFQQGWLRSFVIFLAVFALISTWLLYFRSEKLLILLNASIDLLFLVLLLAVVLIQVFGEGQVTGHRIRGAIVVYLLFGFIWAKAYQLTALLIPGAFQLPANVLVDDPESLKRGMTYYSFITLTTLGYGDITPLAPAARLLAIFEALVGQLYPAITLARLVSLQIIHRSKRS